MKLTDARRTRERSSGRHGRLRERLVVGVSSVEGGLTAWRRVPVALGVLGVVFLMLVKYVPTRGQTVVPGSSFRWAASARILFLSLQGGLSVLFPHSFILALCHWVCPECVCGRDAVPGRSSVTAEVPVLPWRQRATWGDARSASGLGRTPAPSGGTLGTALRAQPPFSDEAGALPRA